MDASGPGRDGSPELPAFLTDLQAIVAAVLASDGRVIEGNRGFWRLLGVRGEVLAGAGAPWCLEPRFAALTGTAQAADGDASYRGRITLGDPDGPGHTVHGSVGRFGDAWLLVGEVDVAGNERLAERLLELNHDLAERQRELARTNRLLTQREEELARLSNTDALTGLPNRRHLMERLAQEVARSRRSGEPLSVAMVDLDDFKGINDSQGHAAGDRTLEAVAVALREVLRPYDVPGRLGGDEFALVMPGTDAAAARALCERVLARLARVPRWSPDVAGAAAPDGAGGPIKGSVGVATLAPALAGAGRGQAAAQGDSLLSRADKALYRAKRAGGGQVRSSQD